LLSESNKAYYETLDSISFEYSELRNKTDKLIGFIGNLKSEIIVTADGSVNNSGIMFSNQTNTDISVQVLIDTGKAKELKNRIENYANFISTNHSAFYFKDKEVKLLLNTDDMMGHKGAVLPWDVGNFMDISAISVLTILTGLQTNIITCELTIISRKICPSINK